MPRQPWKGWASLLTTGGTRSSRRGQNSFQSNCVPPPPPRRPSVWRPPGTQPPCSRWQNIPATEGRAINNIAIKKNRTHERYLGLTYWTPNINIFRDPRWGRGQETYGEDPFLTAMLGSAFVYGLQGDDPKYLQAAACAKHYAVHSGPEPSRHSFNANVSTYDLLGHLPAGVQRTDHKSQSGRCDVCLQCIPRTALLRQRSVDE